MSLFIENIRFTNFRNISHLRLDIASRITLIAGKNGLGKTNILDGLVRLNTSRGLKNQTSKECINVLNPHYGWGIGLLLSDNNIIQYGRTPNHDKIIYNYNHSPILHEDLRKKIPILWLSPVGEKLFTEEHQFIRYYIDDLLSLCFPAFNHLKLNYDRALKQRLKLLLEDGDNCWITALELEVSQNAVQIIHLRQSFLEIFNHAYEAIIDDTHHGFPPFGLDIVCDSFNYQHIDQYQKQLKSMRPADKTSGRSLFGIHRCRIHVTHKQKNIDIYYCSTGEQKAILSHILFVMNFLLQKHNNVIPIMVFDDALAHYDESRIDFFYNYMQYQCHNQFFLTNTEFKPHINSYSDINLLNLEIYINPKEELLF